ncbi:MAG: hypothetical protein JO339_08065 [Alphaproteobacteria bacterium]|nr:hypothetical protein [Alphaproteobacteria bacterium]
MEAHKDYDEYQRCAADCLMLMRLMTSAADRRAMRLAAQRWRALAGQAAMALEQCSDPAHCSTLAASD